MFDDRYTDDEIDLWGTYRDDADDDTWGNRDWYGNWSRWNTGTTGSVSPERLQAAHRTLKSFVDTFARAGETYRVEFGEGGIAGTNFTDKVVRITSDPLYDQSLSDAEAAQVLVGLACHEAAHSRYGEEYRSAVRAEFGNASSAAVLSNLLGDVSDERSFTAEYPGFGGVFSPALRWTGKKAAELGQPTDPINTGIRAVRYADSVDWTGNEAELAWWNNWAAEYGQPGSPASLHIEGIRTALEHVAEQQPPQQQQGDGDGTGNDGQQADGTGQQARGQQQGGQPGKGKGGQPGKGKSSSDLAKAADDAMTEEQQQQAEQTSDLGSAGKAGTEPASSSANDAAANTGMSDVVTLENVDAGLSPEHELATYGTGLVEHLKASALGSLGYRRSGESSGAASSAIRNAFMRDRGGHTEITKGTKRGRCDNGSLYRIAQGDNRLFHRRSAPSPDNWVVWVMVDWSSSMSQRRPATISAARALAAASRSVGTMRMAVKTWTSGQESKYADASVVDVWETGQSIERLEDAYRGQMGGTPDHLAMAWAVKNLRRELRGSERGMIVFLSDGEGFKEVLKVAVETGRKAGLEIVSVALASLDTQEEVYGADRMIPYRGSITEAAGPLARMLTRVMASGRK